MQIQELLESKKFKVTRQYFFFESVPDDEIRAAPAASPTKTKEPKIVTETGAVHDPAAVATSVKAIMDLRQRNVG